MNVQYTRTMSGATVTVVDEQAPVISAPGIIPRYDARLVAEDASWRVRVTWKGAIKDTSGDGGLQDKHAQAWRGWPSVKHRTTSLGEKVKAATPVMNQLLQELAS